MSIDKIRLQNITVFKSFEMNFSKGINIIIGQNATGKTTILKMLYAACEWSNEKTHQDKARSIADYFSCGRGDMQALKSHENREGYSCFTVISGSNKIEYSISHDGVFDHDTWLEAQLQSVFIPTTEMLSHSNGFLAMSRKYNMPFDATQIDIIVNAELPETKEISGLNKNLLNTISEIIDGKVIYENDTFYIEKSNGMKVQFSLEAEGLRKFGLLWKLIRNGLIEKGSILFWDEPEANINPELMPALVEILIELQRNGVQIFIATHSYNLAKYFEIKRAKSDPVLYHNLYKTNDGVMAQSGEYFGSFKNNSIIEADSRLLDEVVEAGFGE